MGIFNNTDSYLFHQGTSYEVYKKMGAHTTFENGEKARTLPYGLPTRSG